MGRYPCPICNVGTFTSPSTPPPKGRTVSGGDPVAVRPTPYVSVPEAACTVRVPPAMAARSGRGRFSAARWEPAMLRIIQTNHLARNLNVLAVCAVFVFVGALLLGAF